MAATTSRTTERGCSPEPRRNDVIFSQLITKVRVENRKRLYSEQYKVPLGRTCIYTRMYTEAEDRIRVFA